MTEAVRAPGDDGARPSPTSGPSVDLVRLALISALSGALTGLVGAAFRVALIMADNARDALIVWAGQWPRFGWLLPVLVATVSVGVAYWLVQRFAPVAAGSGVQHVEAVMRGQARPAPLAVLPVKFIGGVLAIGSGLALGREGPTVQMGATVGARVAALVKMNDAAVRTIQGAAAGAGLAVAFNAPAGGIAFVFEELARRFTTEVMVATLAACATAVLVMRALLGDQVDFFVAPLTERTVQTVAVCLLLGVLLGVLGAGYNWSILAALDLFAALSRVPGIARAAFVGGVVGLVAWFEPRLVGGGDPIIQGVLDERLTLFPLVVIIVARWIIGPISYASGVPGGLFAPLLVVGAAAGAVFADVLNRLAPGLAVDTVMCAIAGMAAFFAAVVRAPLTGTLLVLGMTGTVLPMVPILMTCIGATVVPFLLGSVPIYDTLRERLVAGSASADSAPASASRRATSAR